MDAWNTIVSFSFGKVTFHGRAVKLQVGMFPETNIAPENGCLEYDRFLFFWEGNFSRASC